MYLPLRRANLPTLLNLFDFGDATTEIGKRSLTNVAPQALFMMNSEFVIERAKNIAQAVLDDADAHRSAPPGANLPQNPGPQARARRRSIRLSLTWTT